MNIQARPPDIPTNSTQHFYLFLGQTKLKDARKVFKYVEVSLSVAETFELDESLGTIVKNNVSIHLLSPLVKTAYAGSIISTWHNDEDNILPTTPTFLGYLKDEDLIVQLQTRLVSLQAELYTVSQTIRSAKFNHLLDRLEPIAQAYKNAPSKSKYYILAMVMRRITAKNELPETGEEVEDSLPD